MEQTESRTWVWKQEDLTRKATDETRENYNRLEGRKRDENSKIVKDKTRRIMKGALKA